MLSGSLELGKALCLGLSLRAEVGGGGDDDDGETEAEAEDGDDDDDDEKSVLPCMISMVDVAKAPKLAITVWVKKCYVCECLCWM